MPLRVSCPSCQATYSIDDASRGKTFRCQACQRPFGVQPTPSPVARSEDRTAPAPRGTASPPPPVPAPPPRDTRDEDERPARNRRKKADQDGPSTGLLVGVLAGCVVLTLVFGGVAIAFWSSGETKPGPDVGARPRVKMPPAPPSAAPPPKPPEAKPPKAKPPKAKPEVKPEVVSPPAAPPATLSAADLGRVKKATVHLKVNLPGGGVSQGTGFFAVEPGVIITNAHVLGMLTPDSLAPAAVTVTLNSGETDQSHINAAVLGVDRTNDLAVLRADAPGSPLPPPLELEPAGGLTETQKVYVFGFPLAAQLGKNITVSETSVTSLRKKDGVLQQVQVKGGMNPGNSGGPVTDTRGVVVGVAVAIIRGTEISFAVPGEYVQQVLAGGISGLDHGTPYAGPGGRPYVPFRLTALDPLRRARKVRIEVWAGPDEEALPASEKEPPRRPGDGERQLVAATAIDGGYAADVPLPPLLAGQVYWAQPVTVGAGGRPRWAAARVIPFDPTSVIERKAAELRFKAPAGPVERTLRVTSNRTVRVFSLDEPLSLSLKMDGHMLESSAPDGGEAGTRARLLLHRPRFTRELGGKVLEAPPALGGIIARLSPSYLIAADHSVARFTRPGLDGVPADLQEVVGELFDSVCNCYEATTLPLPNRELRPQETWAARVPVLISTGPPRQEVQRVGTRTVVRPLPSRKEVRALNLTCTYEGTRSVDGVPQAYVRLAGVVNGNGPKAKEVYGKVTGHAVVNLRSGMLSQVRTVTSLELEPEDGGARVVVTNESTIDRVEGNTQGIRLPPPPVTPERPPVVTVPAVPGRPEDVKKDLARLQGEWDLETLETDGKGSPGTNRGAVFEGDTYRFVFGSRAENKSRVVLNPNVTPKTIALEKEGPFGGTWHGIYRFNDDGTLEVCITQPGTRPDAQPTKFTTKTGEAGAASIRYVFRRTKVEKEVAASEEDVKKELKRLEGTWEMVRIESEGKSRAPSVPLGVIIDGTDYNGTNRGRANSKARLTINPNAGPKRLELEWVAAAVGGTTYGIYRFNDDGTLELCVTQPNSRRAARPTKFTTKPGEEGGGSIIWVFRRTSG